MGSKQRKLHHSLAANTTRRQEQSSLNIINEDPEMINIGEQSTNISVVVNQHRKSAVIKMPKQQNQKMNESGQYNFLPKTSRIKFIRGATKN